jgi:hypothetical protein
MAEPTNQGYVPLANSVTSLAPSVFCLGKRSIVRESGQPANNSELRQNVPKKYYR